MSRPKVYCLLHRESCSLLKVQARVDACACAGVHLCVASGHMHLEVAPLCHGVCRAALRQSSLSLLHVDCIDCALELSLF